MMGDGKALQMGTSHELGQNFSRAFGIQFSDAEGVQQFGWQTSWGASTRLIGALIMAHGDDFGLRLPPALAPVEVGVMVAREGEGVQRAAEALVAGLAAAGRRTRLDDRTGTGFGRRSVDWELKGVPVRVEVGPRELAEGQVTVVTRHTRAKDVVPLEGLVATVAATLDTVGPDLVGEARRARQDRTVEVDDVADAVAAGATGFARVPWSALGPEGEARLAADGVSVRCLQRPDGGLAPEGDEGPLVAVVGRAY